MALTKSFVVYRCTHCDKFHFSDSDHDSLFEAHTRFHDGCGMVTRYQLNEKVEIIGFVTSILLSMGVVAALISRAVAAWPNKPRPLSFFELCAPQDLLAVLLICFSYTTKVSDLDLGRNNRS